VRFIHTADLHIAAAAKEYSLAVLAEIGATAVRENAGVIVFAGDTFDSFADAVQCRGDLARWAEALPAGIAILLLPGNHEELGRGTNTLAALNFGSRVQVITATPFEAVTVGDTEFLLFPFREGYFDPASVPLSPHTTSPRVAVMHGTVAGMAYLGEGPEEAENSLIDPSIFARMGVCYAALGHLHGAREERIGETLVVYPGSPRVWRKGERGPRTVSLVDTTARPVVQRRVAVAAAGQFREYHMPLSLDGRGADVDRIAGEWSREDMISIVLTGMVDDENTAAASKDEIVQAYAGRVRSLEVTLDVEPVAGIAAHPAAAQFLTLLATQASGVEQDVLERARKLGLAAVAKKMGGA
jgi:DNA repair exonuclease SbcCD nuclease subunit